MLQWIGMAASAYSSISGAQASNRAASRAQQDTIDRLELQGSIAEQMIDEQQQNVLEKTTDITRQFLQAKGKMVAGRANMGVTGKAAQRLALMQRSKASEAKGKIMKEAETNVVNIANDMVAKKLDADANINRLQAQKKSTATILFNAASAGMSGYMAGTQFAASGAGTDFMSIFSSSPSTASANADMLSAMQSGAVDTSFSGLKIQGYM